MSKEQIEKLGHTLGGLLAAVIYVCGMSVAIALTIKLVAWILGM